MRGSDLDEVEERRVVTVVVVLLTLGAIVLRPGGHHEWVPTAVGVAALAVVGALTVTDTAGVLTETAPVVAFLLAVTVLGGAADRAGLFDVLALAAGRAARGDARRLLVAVVLLAFAVTTVLSLDATVVLLTPAVVAVVRRTGAPPLPLLLAVVFTANAGSLLLPISNLTNLLVQPRLGGTATYAAAIWPAQLAALVTLAGVLAVRHRRVLAAPLTTDLPPARTAIADHRAVLWAGAAIASLVPVLVLTEGWGLAAGTAVAAAVATAASVHVTVRAGTPGPRVPWRLGLFVAGLFVLVDAAARGPLGATARLAVGDAGPVVVGVVGAVTSNLLNNLPAFLLLAPAVADGPPLLGLLIGVNLGPNLLTIGSLATLLWLAVLRQHGLAPSPLRFLREGLVVAPPTVAVALGVLVLTT